MASGVGESDGPVRVDVPVTGASVLPPAPVHLRIDHPGSGAMLRWTRRSRSGWRWIDGSDAPLGEERESYRVTLTGPDGTRTIECDAPILTLEGDAAALAITVAQRGTNGISPRAKIG